MSKDHTTELDSWNLASGLLYKYLSKPSKSDDLLNGLPDNVFSKNRRSCQWLFLGIIRHKSLIDYVINKLVTKKPRIRLRIILMLGIYEILDSNNEFPKIVDHAVRQARELLSKNEAGLVNAVLRNVPPIIQLLFDEKKYYSKDWLSVRYSHPSWLIERWIREFGSESTQKLLQWNQIPPNLYFRTTNPSLIHATPTKWPNFYKIDTHWPILQQYLKDGTIYIQDPSTASPLALAEVKNNDIILDLCAAPGGKSIAMAELLKNGPGHIISLDLPGNRITKLKENLSKLKNVNFSVLEQDINNLSPQFLQSYNLPNQYDLILLDAPCSNTGVLRRRPDAKWRLSDQDISKMATIQLSFLEKAAPLLKPGGRLVYSTCSIEKEENILVVDAFLKKNNQTFEFIKGKVSYPWEDDCDGGGAFLIKKRNQPS